jgi:hypothetical protein
MDDERGLEGEGWQDEEDDDVEDEVAVNWSEGTFSAESIVVYRCRMLMGERWMMADGVQMAKGRKKKRAVIHDGTLYVHSYCPAPLCPRVPSPRRKVNPHTCMSSMLGCWSQCPLLISSFGPRVTDAQPEWMRSSKQ